MMPEMEGREAETFASHVERLARELDALPPEAVAAITGPGARRRLARRDAALREARDLIADARPIAAACQLERTWRVYLASPRWRRDRWADEAGEGSDAMERALHQASRMNHGRAVGWRQIDNIVSAQFRG